ncbi:RNA-binding protein [bacterium]|nr:RNA-binding protein [bacterium]
MAKKLYVGNLPFSVTVDEIRALFEKHGAVLSVNLINDRETGRPRGFGFVEMEDPTAALSALDGYEFGGRTLRVNEAEERRDTRGGGGRGGGGGNWRR